MILLNENHQIAKGSERLCYLHPQDSSKIIKTIYHKLGTVDQNIIEYNYYKELNRQNVAYTHIPKCYGFATTNKGTGLIFDNITNYDGTPAITIRNAISNQEITYEEIMASDLLNDLKSYLEKNKILFRDATTVNVLYVQIAPNTHRLIIIDGLGPRRENFKIILYKYCPFYLLYKIKKQWKVFLYNLHRLKVQTLQ